MNTILDPIAVYIFGNTPQVIISGFNIIKNILLTEQDCRAIEGRPHANRIRRHAFLLLLYDDLDIQI